MKSPLHVLALLCVIGAVAAYFCRDIPATHKPQDALKPETSQIRPIGNNREASHPSSKTLVESQLQESSDKMRLHAEKAYENATPKTERLKLDAIMRFREPHYRELFGKWDISAENAGSVLAIIEEREAELMAKRRAFLLKGPSGASEFRTEQKIAQALADQHLSRLLGQEKAAELRQLDRQLDKEYLARARRNSGD